MIDPKNVSQAQLQKIAFTENMKGVFTCIPGHIVTFNPTLQRAQIQIGVERVLNNGATEVPRVIDDVPVIFHGSSQYTFEFEVGEGTEGAIYFSQRCIDGWKNSGGVASNNFARFFHPQDAFFMPGLRSQSGAISGFQNNGARLRNKSGSQYVWLKKDGTIEETNGAGFVKIMPDGNVNINGVIFTPTGSVTVPQNLGVVGTLQNGGVNVGKDHKHSGVQTGGSNTGNPI